jgi:glycosyltransferase involved in cell wall biosynthesis
MRRKGRRVALSVVVPCYNEVESIAAIARRFSAARPTERGFQLVLVDNGSGDGTWAELGRICRRHRFVKRARVRENIGYGYGILAGLGAADGEFLCWTHADLQADPLDAAKAYGIAQAQRDPRACFVKGRRRNRPALDAFFTLGMSAFSALALGRWLDDINAQPNLFHRDFLPRLRDAPRDFSFDLYAFYRAKEAGMEIVRLPVDFSKRAHGESHWNTGIAGKWKFIRRTALFTLELRRRLLGERKCRG